MNNNLSEMTNEELSKLFPIILSKHNAAWSNNYQKEKAILERGIGKENIARINHIGSTVIPGILAKPTIDILIEINDTADIKKLIWNIQSVGYIYTKKPENPPPHMMFIKGYTPEGFKGQAFHVHVRYVGDWDEIYFLRYLLKHPEIALEYEKLKLELKSKFEHDRDGYTNAKTDFIKRITNVARLEFLGKI
jgi:GrpB-like predicted nucleotidyltransferase (UPF0157 family)